MSISRFASYGGGGGLSALTDPDNLREAGFSLAGGAIGGLAFGVSMREIEWFGEGSPNVQLAKKAGLTLGLSILSAVALWERGEDARNASKGVMGAAGASLAAMLFNKFMADPKDATSLIDLRMLAQQPTADSFVSLDATRVYQDEIPANIGRTRVTSGPVPGLEAIGI